MMEVNGTQLDHQLLEIELRILTLERTIEVLISKIPTIGGPIISQSEFKNLQFNAAQDFQKKYAKLNIKLNFGVETGEKSELNFPINTNESK